MWPAFFIRVKPASRKAKPACMNITSTAVTTTQIVLAAISRSWFLGNDIHLLETSGRPVVGHVRDGRGPHDPVPRLVAASRRVDDRGHDLAGLFVFDHEQEQRFRQEARLEDPAAVLVGHAPLAAMADRLDYRDADVAGGVLD